MELWLVGAGLGQYKDRLPTSWRREVGKLGRSRLETQGSGGQGRGGLVSRGRRPEEGGNWQMLMGAGRVTWQLVERALHSP